MTAHILYAIFSFSCDYHQYADIALQCVCNKNDEGLIEALTHITNALRAMKKAVAQIHGELEYTVYGRKGYFSKLSLFRHVQPTQLL